MMIKNRAVIIILLIIIVLLTAIIVVQNQKMRNLPAEDFATQETAVGDEHPTDVPTSETYRNETGATEETVPIEENFNETVENTYETTAPEEEQEIDFIENGTESENVDVPNQGNVGDLGEIGAPSDSSDEEL